MLEQAIIDAEALKEAAVKNAETLVLEKYSNQIKEAVDSLLEQEDPLAAAMADLGPPAEDAGMPESPEAPMAAPVAELPVEKSTILEQIPLAATSKNDEEIEISLDKLAEELNMVSRSFKFGGDSHNIPDELFENHESKLTIAELSDIEETDSEGLTTDKSGNVLDEELDEELEVENIE